MSGSLSIATSTDCQAITIDSPRALMCLGHCTKPRLGRDKDINQAESLHDVNESLLMINGSQRAPMKDAGEQWCQLH